MRSLAVCVLAAVTAIAGLTAEAYAERRDNDGRNPYYSGRFDNGGYYRYRRWRGYRAYYGPRYVVRRGYYRGDGCMRRRFDAYGNVYYKVRRACRW